MYMYDLTLSLLDEFLTSKVIKRHTNERPLVTDQFRSLFRRRRAWLPKDLPNYRRLRNKINRMLPKLKKEAFCRYQITLSPNY